MNLTLKRFEFGTHYTIGRLYRDEEYLCYTLEDKVQDPKVFGETAIPEGTYTIVVDYSNRFKKMMPHLLNVPGFTGIRIHPGNSSKDTEGCILLGMNWAGNNWISSSTMAFEKFMTLIKDQKDITIKVM